MHGPYAFGYVPQGAGPQPPQPPPQHMQVYPPNIYPRLPVTGGSAYPSGVGQSHHPSSPPFIPQNPPPPPSPPHLPYNSGAPHPSTVQHPRQGFPQQQVDSHAYSMPGQYLYVQANSTPGFAVPYPSGNGSLPGFAIPYGAFAPHGNPQMSPPRHVQPYGPMGYPAATYQSPYASGWADGQHRASQPFIPISSGHAGAPSSDNANPPQAAATGPIIGPTSYSAAAATSTPTRRRSPASQGSSPAAGPGRHSIHQDPGLFWIPEGAIVRGRVPPPNEAILDETFGVNMPRKEQLAVWWSLSELDQRRIIAEHEKLHAAAPLTSEADPRTSASAAGRRSKGKAKATFNSATPAGGSAISGAGQASATYMSPYVEEIVEPESSYGGTQTIDQGGSSGFPSFRPAAHRMAAFPSPLNPGVPQGNHIGVVVLDAINGLTTQVIRIGTLIDGFIQYFPVDPTHQNDGSHGVPGACPPPVQHGRQGDPDQVGEDGYAADDDEEVTEEKRLKAQRDAQKAKDKPYRLRLKECVRKHMKYVLLKVKSTKALPSRYPPHTAEEIEAYNRGDAPPIDRENFRPDFVLGWKSTDYNIDARFFCIEDFVREAKGGLYSEPALPSRFLTFDVVSKAIDNHMDYLRRQYRLYAAPMTPQQILKLERMQERKRINARKATMYKVRTRTIDRHSLVQHKDLFDVLEPCHMSADELEVENENDDRQTHPRVYTIVDAAWQSQAFKTFVRTLELWNIADWRQSIKGKLPGGNAPRTRVEKAPTCVVDSKAPEGLWRNCYNQTWLDALPGHVRARLNIIDSDYDFSLPTYQKPTYVDPKDFPLPEDEDEDAEWGLETELDEGNNA